MHQRLATALRVGLVALVPAAAWAQSLPEILHPEFWPHLARGQRAWSSGDTGAYDRVDLFGGGLSFGLPLGLEYPVDSRLSYELRLQYTSQVWDPRASPLGPVANPMALSNAGLGFDLSLGRLFAPQSGYNRTAQWLYVDREGGAHLFYSSLHWDTPDPADPADDLLYTRDGSYQRLRRVSTTRRFLEFPDGRQHRYDLQSGEWRLTRLTYQGETGWVDVTYAADGFAWTLADSLGRVQRVVFRADPSGRYPRLVDRVELTAFGGATAVYQLTYQVASVPRACYDVRGGSESVPLLVGLTDPLGQARAFEHYATGSGCEDAGRLKQQQLASGGFVRYDYAATAFPPLDCAAASPAFMTTGATLATRELRTPDGALAGAWTYAWAPAGTPACAASARAVTVTTPLGHQWRQHFAVAASSAPALYGLPIDPGQLDDSGTRRLARVIEHAPGARRFYSRWEQDEACASILGNCFDTNRRLAGERVRYDDDPLAPGVYRYADRAFSEYDGLGHYRVSLETGNFGAGDFLRTRAEYNLAAGAYVPGADGFTPPGAGDAWTLADAAGESLFDGAAGYASSERCFSQGRLVRERRRARSDSLAASAKDVLVVSTWTGGHVTDIAYYGGDLDPLPLASTCTFDLTGRVAQYRLRRSFSNGVLAREEYLDAGGQPVPGPRVDRDIDPRTGLVAVERTAAGLATAFTYDASGRLTWSKPSAEHRGAWTQYVYRGPLGTSGWSDGPRVTTIEFTNGGAGELTRSYLWHDVFGRPSGEETGLPGGARSRRRFKVNALGWRTAESTRFTPGVQTPLYSESLELDPFGRAWRVRPPEGAAHDRTWVYLGVREARRSVPSSLTYAFGVCQEAPATLVQRFDRQGRLWVERDERPTPAPGITREITTLYDVQGAPTSRVTVATVGGVSAQSTITSITDGRGFLLWTASTGGLASRRDFLDHDALGRPGREVIVHDEQHPWPGLEIAHVYDRAGRALRASESGTGGRVWKEWSYAGANVTLPDGTLDARRGRQALVKRHNWRNGADVVVSESYVYGGPGGRLSEATLGVARADGFNQAGLPKSYSQGATYDALGNVVAMRYPACGSCSAGEGALARVASATFDGRELTALGGQLDGLPQSWLAEVLYHPTRLPAEVRHGNQVVDRLEVDAVRQPRVTSVTIDGSASACQTQCLAYASGTYVYDGESRVCGVGSESRVVPPTAPPPPPQIPNPCLAAAVYDPFGRPTGESTDAACDSGAWVFYYDIMDRRIGELDQAAKKEVQTTSGEWVWLPDPAQWKYTWTLFGLDSASELRVVEDAYTGQWRSTLDSIYGLGWLVGQEQVRPAAGGPQRFTRHVHAGGGGRTNPDGEKRTGFDNY